MADLFGKVGDVLEQKHPWYGLPKLLAIPALIQIRNDLRDKNLHDTEEPALEKRDPGDPVPTEVLGERTEDGTFNDLDYPKMGSEGRRLGRNFPLAETLPDTANLMNPNPRDVSLALMTRKQFQPAGFVNLLVASRIQFMVHDWFAHKRSDKKTVDIPIRPGDPWPDKPMRIPATEVDPAPAGSTRPPAYANQETHWWDGSQLHGVDDAAAARIRTHADGKLNVGDDAKIPVDPATGLDITGFTENVWIGLNMLHGLFASEHNAICDMLKANHADWTDEQLFQKARLINVAHTTEWTVAIVPHPMVQMSLHTNWYGTVNNPQLKELDFIKDNELLNGIIGSPTDHHSARYSMTEEFIAVYRMHPLLPEEIAVRSAATGAAVETLPMKGLAGAAGRKVFDRLAPVDLFYSFGISNPGALRLNNYPTFLQALTRDDGTRLDLAAVDILRDRERGVPRYNRFRELLRKAPVASFEELTGGDAALTSELKRVYNNDLSMVDLMVGLFAEPLPEGFGFSETAFRVFILMASRRLKSDRFFTNSWGPDTYTPEGMQWITDNGMASVLKRHFPALAAALEGVENPFAPWKKL